MIRWMLFLACLMLGLTLVVCGLLVPAHLRAVDVGVVQLAGRNTPGLVERGLELVKQKQLGTAQLLWQAAQNEGVPGRERLGVEMNSLAAQQPDLQMSGAADPRIDGLFGASSGSTNSRPQPFTDVVVRLENREKALQFLSGSQRPLGRELMRCRALTNTVIFSPSQSASGQAFDAALSVCGLLSEEGRLTPSLNKVLLILASEANRGGNPEPLEQVLLDLMSLGQRLNWGQLAAFTERIEDTQTLRTFANLIRKNDRQLPEIFSAVQLADKPADVASYLMNFSETGLKDLGASLRFGAGGVNELLRSNHALYQSRFLQGIAGYGPCNAVYHWGADCSLRTPGFALTVKWLWYLFGGFLLAMALHFGRPPVSELERPLEVRGFHMAREFLFALGFLLVVLLVSEPFLAQESQNQKVDMPFRLHLPTVGSVVPAGKPGANPSIMNQPIQIKLTLLLFFVLQALLYTACLVKLAEIRRQRISARVKLKLLENEEHLFDAGLYLGFAGTIISLILVLAGVFKQQSLMAAYSSTSFGIIFVVIFKIFHLRPARRKLLLEAETEQNETSAATPAGVYVATS